jgi:rhodanese-related sulfurtransferase
VLDVFSQLLASGNKSQLFELKIYSDIFAEGTLVPAAKDSREIFEAVQKGCGKENLLNKHSYFLHMDTHCWLCRSEIKNGTCISCGYKQSELKKIEIEPTETKSKLDNKEEFVFLDVRNSDETQIAKIEGTKNIPLNEIPQKFTELPNKEIITHCHHGVRSLHAANFLAQKGFRVKSMRGGIDAWSLEVDGSVERY